MKTLSSTRLTSISQRRAPSIVTIEHRQTNPLLPCSSAMSQAPALPIYRVAGTSPRCVEEFPTLFYPPTHPRSTSSLPSAHALELTIKSCVFPESATLQALKAALALLASFVQALNLS